MDRRIIDFNISAGFKKELRQLDEDLLKSCRLTQEAISKTSGILIDFEPQKAQEITDCNKKLEILCVASKEYFSSLLEKIRPSEEIRKTMESGVESLTRLRQIASLAEAIATSISELNGDLPDNYKINASQFAKIIQNIVWDSVFSQLKKDAALANKTIASGQQLKEICLHIQENVMKASSFNGNHENSEDVLIFIAQCMKNMASHAVDIAENAI